MHIEESVRKSEGLSKKEAERLEKMFEEIEEANPSMPPNIYMATETIEIDGPMGSQSLDADVLTAAGLKELKVLIKKFDAASGEKRQEVLNDIYAIIGQYTESFEPDFYSVEIKSGGWMANLSMPGYMDQTEPSRYDTLKKAIEGLHDMYADVG